MILIGISFAGNLGWRWL